MKKVTFPLVFAFSLLLVLTFSVGAFPGMNYSGEAQANNVTATLNVLSIPILGGGVSADVKVGEAQSHGAGTLADLMTTSSESIAASVNGSVLGIPVNLPISSLSSIQSYLTPSPDNPDLASNSLTDGLDGTLLSLGVLHNSTSALLNDADMLPSLVNPTNSLSEGMSGVAGIGIGLDIPILGRLSIIDAGVVSATSKVQTIDASTVTTQGYDAVSCESQSIIAGLDLLDGLVVVDAITTTTTANVNGQVGTVTGSVQIAGLEVAGEVRDDLVLEIGSLPPLDINLAGGNIVLSLAPVLEGSADRGLATASATALRLEVVANALGLGTGTVIEIGSSEVTCAAARGNWNPKDDTDNDGVIDEQDLDDDNDGIPDLLEGDAALDTDSDGIPDSRDLDSDNDGANDVIEAGHNDLDLNGDGQIDGAVGTNGLSNLVEVADDSTGDLIYTLRDSDSDGIIDVRDLDSDNDSIPDLIENGFAAHDSNGDAMVDGADDDFDGILAPVDGLASYGDSDVAPQADADGDGIPNSRDLDSDNDGTLDLVENGQGALDTDNDGMVNGDDFDQDGVLGAADTMGLEYGTGSTIVDTDEDSVPNAYDLDSDNDGATDVMEAGLLGSDPDGSGTLEGVDTDQDGVPDDWDSIPAEFGAGSNELPDADGDDLPDMVELDSDDDGTFDNAVYGDGTDNNNDGMADGEDPDQDGIPESADTAPTEFGLNGTPTAISLASHRVQLMSSSILLLALFTLLGLTVALKTRE